MQVSLPGRKILSHFLLSGNVPLHVSRLTGMIWTSRALYIVHHELWLTHLLAVCVSRVPFDLGVELIRLDTFAKA